MTRSSDPEELEALLSLLERERAAAGDDGPVFPELPEVDLRTLLGEITALKAAVREALTELRDRRVAARDETAAPASAGAAEDTADAGERAGRRQAAVILIDLADRLEPALAQARRLQESGASPEEAGASPEKSGALPEKSGASPEKSGASPEEAGGSPSPSRRGAGGAGDHVPRRILGALAASRQTLATALQRLAVTVSPDAKPTVSPDAKSTVSPDPEPAAAAEVEGARPTEAASSAHAPVSSAGAWVDPRLLAAHHQGLRLTWRRLEGHLEALGVEPIPVVGRPFDPAIMRAVDREHRSSQPDGVVLHEVVRGYRDADGLIRTAEVVVNRVGVPHRAAVEEPAPDARRADAPTRPLRHRRAPHE